MPYTGSLTGVASQWYVIEHQSNNNLMRALPQMWAKGTIKVAQTDAPAVADGMTYPAGTFFVTTSGSTDDHVWLKALVERMGLTARSLAAKVDAPALFYSGRFAEELYDAGAVNAWAARPGAAYYLVPGDRLQGAPIPAGFAPVFREADTVAGYVVFARSPSP